jgi:hypothetical protein
VTDPYAVLAQAQWEAYYRALRDYERKLPGVRLHSGEWLPNAQYWQVCSVHAFHLRIRMGLHLDNEAMRKAKKLACAQNPVTLRLRQTYE